MKKFQYEKLFLTKWQLCELGQFLRLVLNELHYGKPASSIYTERQKSCTTFSFDFFWIKIDDFKNQCSLVFMPVQKTIFVEKIKCV